MQTHICCVEALREALGINSKVLCAVYGGVRRHADSKVDLFGRATHFAFEQRHFVLRGSCLRLRSRTQAELLYVSLQSGLAEPPIVFQTKLLLDFSAARVGLINTQIPGGSCQLVLRRCRRHC